MENTIINLCNDSSDEEISLQTSVPGNEKEKAIRLVTEEDNNLTQNTGISSTIELSTNIDRVFCLPKLGENKRTSVQTSFYRGTPFEVEQEYRLTRAQ